MRPNLSDSEIKVIHQRMTIGAFRAFQEFFSAQHGATMENRLMVTLHNTSGDLTRADVEHIASEILRT